MTLLTYAGRDFTNATDDSNTQTEISADTLRTGLKSDVFGSAIDSDWTEVNPNDINFAEAAGVIAMSQSASQNASNGLEGFVQTASGVLFQHTLTIENYADAGVESGETFSTGLKGIGASDTSFSIVSEILTKPADPTDRKVRALVSDGGGSSSVGGEVDLTGITTVGLRVAKTGTTTAEAWYDIGAGFVSFGTGTLSDKVYNNLINAFSGNADSGDASCDYTGYTQDVGGVYWDEAEAESDNRTFGSTTIQMSTFTVDAGVGTVKYAFSTNGGSSYGAFQTEAQIAALPDETTKTQLRWKAQFNGGNETVIASLDAIKINVIGAALGSMASTGVGL